MTTNNRLGVVICTYNRGDLLIKTLVSLYGCGYAGSEVIDILVVANSCSDDTIARLTEFQSRHPQDRLKLTWREEPRAGKSYALNTAIEITHNDILCFIDDDQIVEPGFLEHLLEGIDQYPNDSIFCGRIWPAWDGTEPSWVHAKEPYTIPIRPFPEFDLGSETIEVKATDRHPNGGNISIRRYVFQNIGNFSTALGPTGHNLVGGEDHEFLRRAADKGFTIRYLPKVRQLHAVDMERTSIGYTLRKSFVRSQSSFVIRALEKRPRLYMVKKILMYLASAISSPNADRRFFYLVRLSASLGEFAGAVCLSGFPDKITKYLRSIVRQTSKITLTIIVPLVVGSGVLALFAGRDLFKQGLFPTFIVATLGTGILLVKSVKHFSQTGPRIRKEILHHYRWYSIYALGRLVTWAFGLMLLIGGSGVILYGVVTVIFELNYSPWLAVLSAALAVALGTILQLCRKLLWNPGLLIASMNYRPSRLYGLWNKLNPGRLRGLYLLCGGIVLVILIAGSWRLVALSQTTHLMALWYASLFYGGLLVWSSWLPQVTTKPSNQSSKKLNIVMVGSDTLRADRLGSGLTPNIDRLSARGAWFTQCYVPCARTAPSLVSLLTGTWPQTHGIRDNFVADDKTKLSVSALPHWLATQGYTSAAISDWCGADMGKFDFGFDHLDVPEDQWNLKYFIRQGPKDVRLFLSLFMHNNLGRKFLPELYYLGGVPLTSQLGIRARNLMSQLAQSSQPFFLNVFYSTTHPPFASEYPWYTRYSSPGYEGESKFAMARLTEPFDIIRRQGQPKEEFDLDQILALYDGSVAQFDFEVGRILKHLECNGLADQTIVVIYSDHGMEFFEHDTWGQGNSATGEASPRVPLLIYDPRLRAVFRIEQIVRSIDVAPTLAELAGVSVPAKTDGISLVPLLRDPSKQLDLCAFNETGVWLTNIPGLPTNHLRYPDLLELITVPNLATGTLALKDEYLSRILAAKDLMIRKGKWKLVYQPLELGFQLLLFDMETDPQCKQNCADKHPEVVQRLRSELDTWTLTGTHNFRK